MNQTRREPESAPAEKRPNGLGTGLPPQRATDAPGLGRRLGDLLRDEGLITPKQLGDVLTEQKETGEKLGAILVRRGLLSEDSLAEVLSRQYRVPLAPSLDDPIPPEIIKLLPADFARKHEVVPIARTVDSVTLAMVDPTNLSVLDEAAFRTGLKVIPAIGRQSVVRTAVEKYYGDMTAYATEWAAGDVEVVDELETASSQDLQDLRASAEHAPVIKLVNTILLDAVKSGASDIHLEPEAAAFRIRVRVDGMLRPMMSPPKRLEAAVTSRVKIMANLDIAERRLPQDGRIKIRHSGREVEVRVSTLPTIFGESVCMRILDQDSVKLDLSYLGLDPWSRDEIEKAIRSPHGMIVITGPTGSGKTTTLYAGVESIKSPDIHIVTVEDPVEYNLKGINQVQVNEEIGLTFAAALRAFLRHDPNVILVGEIRDLETAEIAARAALTGHLVMTTLHTNDSALAIARFLDMGVPSFILAAALRVVVAQRLVRKLCVACREPYEVDEDTLTAYGCTANDLQSYTVFRPKGCPACNAGYKGRIAIYEILPMTPDIRELVLQNRPAIEIRQLARNRGTRTLRETGLARALDGTTSIDEVLRVTGD